MDTSLMEKRYQQSYKIKNKFGLHIRPSTALSKVSRNYKSEIQITYQGHTINPKSIIELLTLGVGGGEQILVTATGEDCKEAVESIGQLIADRFGLVEEITEDEEKY